MDRRNKQCRAAIYDRFFIIFGNAEIRIKINEDLVFSNFAINNAYYNNEKDGVNAILNNENKRESPIIGYEVFQVFFKVDAKNKEN